MDVGAIWFVLVPRAPKPIQALVMSAQLRLREMSSNVVYAIVKAGGRQEKVSVGDVVVVDRLSGDAGDTVELPALLLVDGEKVTTDATKLAKVKVSAEIVRDEKGPKIIILKFKNKTGYRKRQGHRQQLTRLKVTEIK
ncbi:LSU ribosomal protein L21P [Sanguibacter antarcticus]|uniref:Large ribosomal subunit protein bL21 n=1 Tax=Sanguibacter antarcticus TaxID=372484 RepID=A0A2A9E1K8_9MICO|nr:LSU ribosomal protein L21P [Sanguibacter antarcticus]